MRPDQPGLLKPISTQVPEQLWREVRAVAKALDVSVRVFVTDSLRTQIELLTHDPELQAVVDKLRVVREIGRPVGRRAG